MATETVQYCPHCKCKTWHADGVCEWSDGHKPPKTTETPPTRTADCRCPDNP